MKGNCAECCRRWVCEIDPSDCNEWPDPVPVTNADIIRSMSDEELANIIDSELDRCPPNGDCEKMSKDCKACWLNCLQSPAGKKLSKYIKGC